MNSSQVIILGLAAIIGAGIAFLMWALFHLERDKKHRSNSVAHRAEPRRLRH